MAEVVVHVLDLRRGMADGNVFFRQDGHDGFCRQPAGTVVVEVEAYHFDVRIVREVPGERRRQLAFLNHLFGLVHSGKG